MSYVIEWGALEDGSQWMPATLESSSGAWGTLDAARRALTAEVEHSYFLINSQDKPGRDLIWAVLHARCQAAEPGDIIQVGSMPHRIRAAP